MNEIDLLREFLDNVDVMTSDGFIGSTLRGSYRSWIVGPSNRSEYRARKQLELLKKAVEDYIESNNV